MRLNMYVRPHMTPIHAFQKRLLLTYIIKWGSVSFPVKMKSQSNPNINEHSGACKMIHRRLMTKPTKSSVRPAKTQINLGMRPVWSESSQCAKWAAADPMFLNADNEDKSDCADAGHKSRSQCSLCKSIAWYRTRWANVLTAKYAFMQNAQTLRLMTCLRLKLATVIDIAQTARLTAACAVVLFSMFRRQLSAMGARCGSTMIARS